MKKYKTILILLFIACGPQYIQDPNAYVLVTSKYENEPEKIHIASSRKPQLDCSKKTEAECAIALYKASEKFIKEGKMLTNKKLYLSAWVEYMLALTRLTEAQIRVKTIKTELEDFNQWKMIADFKLEQKLNKRIQLCERQIFILKWKR